MMRTVPVNPFSCRMWQLHDRLEMHITEETCRAEIESFSRHGQLVPVLGRALRGDPDHEIELIYGARRLFVARQLNKPLMVEMCELCDRDAIVAMDIENRQRKDISPYERGRSYARWLREGYFRSQYEIGRFLRVSTPQISRLLKLSRLPDAIVETFATPLDISESWGLALADALEDPQRKQNVLQVARRISCSNPRPAATQIYKQLIGEPGKSFKPRPKSRDEVIKDENGCPLLRITRRTGTITLLLSRENLSTRSLDSIRSAIADILQRATCRTGPQLTNLSGRGVHKGGATTVPCNIP